MRQTVALAALLTLLALALIAAERNRTQAPVGANALLYVVADSQRDLTRMPSAFTRLSDGEETKAGDAIASEYVAMLPMTAEDQRIDTYVAGVGARLAPFTHRRLRMKVHYLPDHQLVNAFALPGGHIFIAAALLEKLRTEDQLAMVIAHEMEHVDHYHCAERLQIEAALRKIPLNELVSVPVEVFRAGYSKEEEMEADRDGIRLAARAGYSTSGALDLFQLFARLDGDAGPRARTPQEEVVGIAESAVTGYFRSHPLPAERLAQVKTMIARDPTLAGKPQRPIGLSRTAYDSLN